MVDKPSSKAPDASVIDPDAPASEEEIAASERLRDALADPAKNEPMADFARAVALAHEPRPIDALEHKAIVDRVIAEAPPMETRARTGVVIRVAFGASAVLALAASIALFVSTRSADAPAPSGAAAMNAPFARSRSTQPLFDAPFKAGAASARIDRIAMARSEDFRDNRFTAWGVR